MLKRVREGIHTHVGTYPRCVLKKNGLKWCTLHEKSTHEQSVHPGNIHERSVHPVGTYPRCVLQSSTQWNTSTKHENKHTNHEFK
jgi:hypothetical protein